MARASNAGCECLEHTHTRAHTTHVLDDEHHCVHHDDHVYRDRESLGGYNVVGQPHAAVVVPAGLDFRVLSTPVDLLVSEAIRPNQPTTFNANNRFSNPTLPHSYRIVAGSSSQGKRAHTASTHMRAHRAELSLRERHKVLELGKIDQMVVHLKTEREGS